MVNRDYLFGQVAEFPDPYAQERFAALIGIDDIKARLVMEARVLLDSEAVQRWSKKHHHHKVTVAAAEVARRTPLIVLGGDVGTGKTEVAETFGDEVARSMHIPVTLYPLSLASRGRGAVGEMTSLISDAFAEVRTVAGSARDSKGRIAHGMILLVDEADALAQSRALAQMHHEDRAGVNALIRGIDGLRNDRLPVLTVMCTNRPAALDPAMVRRAAAILPFERPNDRQRRQLFDFLLADAGIDARHMETLVRLTGERDGQPYACTYSDIRQRLVPDAVLEAVTNDSALTGESLVALAERFEATRPFADDTGD